MASQNDLQELLRLITARKVPMMTAMSQVKALQGVNLRSIQQIADAQPDVIERALGNSKTAKSLQSSCKSYLKLPNSKREGDSTSNNPSAKRLRTAQYADTSTEHKSQSVKEQEGALALPLVTDEDEIARASIYINRAPLMLAFGVELLRFTMPQQPLSSRLSLAQAVVSANSISKAAILGLDSVLRDDISWNEGQPKVTVMGRSIAVLKRGDFDNQPEGCMTAPTTPPQVNENSIVPGRSQWTSSKQITYKSSTFVARVSSLEHPNDAAALIRSLFSCEPHLRTATHNAWGYRVKSEVHSDSIGGGVQEVREDYRDDGERGCGEFILRLMKEANVVGAVVVVTRWFGGEMLGPDRWRLMRGCVMEALAERLRIQHSQAGCHDTALWALDRQHQSETPRGQASSSRDLTHRGRTVSGAVTHRPELARAYLLKSFSVGRSAEEQTSVGENEVACKLKSKKTGRSNVEPQSSKYLGCLLGALRLLFESWASHLTPLEMDRRAWSWYMTVRPDVEPGPSGWGEKGWVKLSTILELRHKENTASMGVEYGKEKAIETQNQRCSDTGDTKTGKQPS